MDTVEHVLAAVTALEIDDILISLDGPEPPIMDGSAGPFFEALTVGAGSWRKHAGCVESRAHRFGAAFASTDGDSVYEATPADVLEFSVSIDFAHPVIGAQSYSLRMSEAAFGQELAFARTFGFAAQQGEYLRARTA